MDMLHVQSLRYIFSILKMSKTGVLFTLKLSFMFNIHKVIYDPIFKFIVQLIVLRGEDLQRAFTHLSVLS